MSTYKNVWNMNKEEVLTVRLDCCLRVLTPYSNFHGGWRRGGGYAHLGKLTLDMGLWLPSFTVGRVGFSNIRPIGFEDVTCFPCIAGGCSLAPLPFPWETQVLSGPLLHGGWEKQGEDSALVCLYCPVALILEISPDIQFPADLQTYNKANT